MIELILDVVDPARVYYDYLQSNLPDVFAIFYQRVCEGSILLTVVLAIMGVYAFYRIITSFCR